MSSNKIVQLFSGESTTGNGDTLASLRELGDEDLESRHDYIQYMFPSEEASQFNSVAPTITPDVIEEFKRREELRNELVLNFQRILAFWDFGVTEDKDGKVTVWLKPEFNAKPADDVIFRNTSKFHNFLRLTRVIKSLHTLGCTKHAVAFRDFACETLVNTIKVPLTTVKFWKNSMNDDPSPASVTAQTASEPELSSTPSSTSTADISSPTTSTVDSFVEKAQNLINAQESNKGSDYKDFSRSSEAEESRRINDGRETDRVSDTQVEGVSAVQESDESGDRRISEPELASSLKSTTNQTRASEPVKPSSLRGRRSSLNPQAEIVDPEHEEINKTVVRAQAEEAVIAAKLAEAERNFAEKAERLEAERLASEERQRQQQEEIERVRAKQREKEEEEQKKKDQSLASKFMKLGEKATGWTMGEQKNRHLDEKPPIVFKGVNDFSPTKGYNEQMERERQEELRRRQMESEQCFGCMNAFM